MAPDAPSPSRSVAGGPTVPGVDDLVLVGRGGHGLVYRGHQADLGRDVAVKLLTAAPDERTVQRWRREVTAMGRLSNHPHIVAIFSEGVTDDGHPYLVMPYLPGGSLHDRIRATGPLAAQEVVVIGRRLASALSAAHAAGVLHRDVKPANVMFSEYGEPQLGDFGIARLADSATTATGSVHATLEYAAPEVLSGQPATAASDVYGLGATLHAALSGASPFGGPADEPLAARVSRVATQPPPDLVAAGVPAGLAAVVASCLAKDPAGRPASADRLGTLLDDVRGGGEPPPTTAVLPPAGDQAVPGLDATAVQVPVVGEAMPPPPRPRSAPADEARPRGAGRLTTAAVAAVVVVLLASAALAWIVARDDGAPDDGAAGTNGSSEAATTSEPDPTTAATVDTTTPTTADPTSPPTTTEDERAEGGSTDEARAAVEDYYARVASGDAEGAWELLSPDFRSRQGREEYLAFWESVESVEVRGRPRADEDGSRVEATLVFQLVDGRTSVEDVAIGLVREGDDLLIDTYEVVRVR